jgi:hypothetical protein
MEIRYRKSDVLNTKKNKWDENMHVLREDSEHFRFFKTLIEENTNFLDSEISLMNLCCRCDETFYDDAGSEVRGIIEKDGMIVNNYGYFILELSGGKNGRGVWSEYLEDLSILFHNFSNKGYDAYMICLVNDCADDIFYPTIGVK